MREFKGRIFLAMELLKGGSLATLIKSRTEKGLKFSDYESATIMRNLL